ncbi:MAG: TonB-dependent receptor family protein [Chitinophagaceae bacterium]
MSLGVAICPAVFSQKASPVDSSLKNLPTLPEVTVIGKNISRDIMPLPELSGTSIFAGKKTSVILPDQVKGNLVTNTMRQVMAKVPGIHVWENDGSGLQIGISTRGLSPNRSWEWNVRQNGYDIAADPYGYPEAYYHPPLQAVQRLELIRGHGSLQYGPQFGGLMNFILHNGSGCSKPFQLESQQTLGSFQMLSNYLSVGGQTSKIHYYSYYNQRSARGWRDNSAYHTRTGFATITYKISSKWSVTSEAMVARYTSQQPGGLTDEQLRADARQSLRKRNWMDLSWFTGAWIANYTYSSMGQINLKLFSVMGKRTSLGFLKPITQPDTLLALTQSYANRTLDLDRYTNVGLEGRILHRFTWGALPSAFSGGIRLYSGSTLRYREGKGTTGLTYEPELVDGIWPKDLDFLSKNLAVFAEQIVPLSARWMIIPGFRYETISAQAEGYFKPVAAGLPWERIEAFRRRSFMLGGIGTEYHFSPHTELYGNITRAYRPIQFADLTAPPTTDVIDPALKDATGFNADLGYRGKISNYLYVDVSVFVLQYNNRIGVLTLPRADGSVYNFRTNIGKSQSRGVEAFLECQPLQKTGKTSPKFDLSFFIAYSYTHAVYTSYRLYQKIQGDEWVEANLRNNRVENAPSSIFRGGATLTYKQTTLTTQWSAVSGTFADANNTAKPSANAQVGWIPGYQLLDLTFASSFSSHVQLRAGLNNLFNVRYFTRRAGGYPGPGALPGEGRSFFVTIILKS